MKLVEFAQPLETNLPYDVIEDAVIFMRNDPMFYRKYYYPAISKIAELTRTGKKVNTKKIMGPVVDKGMHSYCKKYNLKRRPSDLFDLDDRQMLLDKICSEEFEQIRKGAY